MKIFVPNKGAHDYSDAERFGDLVFLSEGLINRFEVGLMYRLSAEALKDSNPDDLILLTGLATFQNILCAVFAHKHGCLNVLIYKEGHYIKETLILGNLNFLDKKKRTNL